jgi:hypothetical protein
MTEDIIAELVNGMPEFDDERIFIDYILLVLNEQLTYLCGKKLYRMQYGESVDDLQIEIDMCRNAILYVKETDDER